MCAPTRIGHNAIRARDRGTGSAGKRIAFVPERSANLGIDAAGRGALAGSLDVSYVGQTFADDLEGQPLSAALLVAATLRETTASGTAR